MPIIIIIIIIIKHYLYVFCIFLNRCAKNESIFSDCISGNATEVDGNTVLESMDILELPVWANLVALAGFLVLLRLLAYYILKIKHKPK